MNISYDWLRAFVPFDESPPQLRDLITARTTVVDELVPLRADLAPIVVARVVEEAPHPDSDHLHVTKVDAGTGTLLDVVCGAPNVAAGKLYPFAMTGTLLPNGVKIERRKIRGAISNGMLCSETELRLGDDSNGIMELDVDVAPGTPLLSAIPLGDMRLVLDVAANRPDLLSHLGVAREVAAATGKPLGLPDIDGLARTLLEPVRDVSEAQAGPVRVRVDEHGLVNRFMGVVMRDVKIAPSPDWLVRRIESVGGRSINNVVDASNYVLHELGQPTHAFDLAKLDGRSIVVRRARAGERITTLDGVARALGEDMIVIADASRPQALAGVMGGHDSEVTASTTDIFLEVANFNPRRIRDARRALGMFTDASYRFERGVDVELAPAALTRVAQLIVLLAGGQVDGSPVDLAHARVTPTPITLRTRRVETVLGDAVPASAMGAMLQSLGFAIEPRSDADAIHVTAPSWRVDVSAEVDLIEEIARVRGYDSFPDEIRAFRRGTVPDDPRWLLAKRIREALVGIGIHEAQPLPFVGGGEGFVRLSNPLAENEAHLRRSVMDTLARRAEYNLARMQGNVRLFEIGSVFEPRTGSLPREELRVGVLVIGRREPPHFTDLKSPQFDEWIVFGEWDAKAIGELVAKVVHPATPVALEPAASTDGVLWRIYAQSEPIGVVQRVALDAPVWAAPAFGVEISLGMLESAQVAPAGHSAYEPPERHPPAVTRFRPLPTTPAAEFDLALLVPESVRSDTVEAVIRGAAGDLLERLELFDRYVGAGVEPGQRSLAWRLTFRHAERTLRDKEIEGRRAKILATLAAELNVRQR